jgi:hypothetical protein
MYYRVDLTTSSLYSSILQSLYVFVCEDLLLTLIHPICIVYGRLASLQGQKSCKLLGSMQGPCAVAACIAEQGRERGIHDP